MCLLLCVSVCSVDTWFKNRSWNWFRIDETKDKKILVLLNRRFVSKDFLLNKTIFEFKILVIVRFNKKHQKLCFGKYLMSTLQINTIRFKKLANDATGRRFAILPEIIVASILHMMVLICSSNCSSTNMSLVNVVWNS